MDIYYIHMLISTVYTVCFGIVTVSLNAKCSYFFMFTLKISQNCWSWKFGQHVYEPCQRFTY